MESLAFKMFLNPGHEAEYKKRHDELWPEIESLLKEQGVVDYRIYLDNDTHILFATLTHDGRFNNDEIKASPAMKRWWDFMADIMQSHDNNEPVSVPLDCVFTLD